MDKWFIEELINRISKELQIPESEVSFNLDTSILKVKDIEIKILTQDLLSLIPLPDNGSLPKDLKYLLSMIDEK